jgi:hypothetical protein
LSVAEEFATVDVILGSQAETRAVDAFSLAVIKTERQARKLFTHLIYQFPAFGPADFSNLRNALAANRRVYFKGFVAGIDALYPRSVEDLVGSEYRRLRKGVDEATDHRNKIFHGQLTTYLLSREELIDFVEDLRSWCEALAKGASAEFGYDGFGRNSLHKSALPNLSSRYRVQMNSIADYTAFIRANMAR